MRRGPELVEGPGITSTPFTECAAIGAMLLREDAREYGVLTLHTGIISNEWNRNVFLALAVLHRRQKHDKAMPMITPIEVSEELVRRKKWDAQGAAFTYCHDLIEYCMAPGNFRHYIDETKRTAQTRSLYALGEFLDLGANLRNAVLQPDADPRQLAAACRECLDTIERDGCADIQAIFQRTK